MNFIQHREALFSKMTENSLAVIPSADIHLRNRDADFPFRQSSDFFYLTGFTEDSACLVLQKKAGACQSYLFCQAKVKEMEIWTGYRLGPDAAVDQLGLTDAFNIDELAVKLPTLMADCDQVYAAWGADKAWDARLIESIEKVKLKARTGVQAPTAMQAIEPLLHELRLIKDDAEIDIMAKAADISAHAHMAAMKQVKPGMF